MINATWFISGIILGMTLMFMAQLPKAVNEKRKEKFNMVSTMYSQQFISGGQYEEIIQPIIGIEIPEDKVVEQKASDQNIRNEHKTPAAKGLRTRSALIPVSMKGANR